MTLAKHEHARDRVLDLLDSLEVGLAIPPERRLSREIGVSRMTLRRAVDELVREGRLVRRQGSGTFVAEPKVTQHLTMTSFSEDMRSRGLVPASATLSMDVLPAGTRVGRRLALPPEAPVLRIGRLRLANDEPIAIEVLYVPEALVPGLTTGDLEVDSFYALLEKRYGVVVASGTQTVEPTVVDREEARTLRVPAGSPALLFERTTRSRQGRTVEFVRSVYRGDRYKITIELQSPLWRTARQPDTDGRPP